MSEESEVVEVKMKDGSLLMGVYCHDGHSDVAYEASVALGRFQQDPINLGLHRERLRVEMRKHRQEMH